MLLGFIFTIFFLYQRKKRKQEQEVAAMKEQFSQELLRTQLEIQEATLKTIAQELHDNIGQVLSVIKLWLAILPVEQGHAAYEGVQNSREMLNKVIFDMADLTKSLHTDRITEIGLTEAIRFDLETLKKTGLIQINFAVSGEQVHFDQQKSIFLFRMYQEIMNNMLKHAKASNVNVSINYSADYKFVLTVEDDGVGFDLSSKQKQVSSSSGLGLKNMKNRARLIGADIHIQSQLQKGTTVSVELPVRSSL
ncbi:MAG TPA: ATP-binding protein [Puia sp.]|nr:ATP-binding protein [Puia sp.]